MRSAIGGWVENQDRTLNGLAIIIELTGSSCGVLTSGRAATPASSLRSADASASGSWVSSRAGGVGLVLARAADRELDQAGRERAEEEHQQPGERVARASRPPPKNSAKLASAVMRGGDRAGDRRDQDVAVVDVAELVPEDGAQLALVEDLQDALGGADRGVARRRGPSRRRSARRSATRTAAASARGRSREFADDAVHRRLLHLGDRPGAHRPQGELVGIEVGEGVQRHGEDQRDHDALGARDGRADDDEQRDSSPNRTAVFIVFTALCT